MHIGNQDFVKIDVFKRGGREKCTSEIEIM